MQTDDVLRALRCRRNRVDVLVGRVGRENGARLTDFVEAREDGLLQLGVLEHGFDDEIHVGERRVIGRATDQRPALLALSSLSLPRLTLAA